MATNFPGSQDSLTNPSSGDTLDSPDHAGQHSDANDAIEAIELALLDGAPLHIDDANERVGIGTTSPEDVLHVVGDTTIEVTDDGSAAQPEVTLHRGSASPADGDYLGQVKFSGKNDAGQTVNYAKITGKISDVTDTTEDGLIEIANIKAGSQSIGYRITSTDLKLINSRGLQVDGNVGIGTTAPDNKLHVQLAGTSKAPASVPATHMIIADAGDTNDAGVAVYSATTGKGYLRFGDSGGSAMGGFSYDHSVDKLYFRTGGSDRGAVDSSGNVGIGTTSPTAALTFGNVVGNKIDFYYTSGDRYGIQVQSSELRIHSGAGGNGTGGITLGKSTETTFTEHMRITNDGNVGIGDTTPDYKLDVNGTFRATGIVRGDDFLGFVGSASAPTFSFMSDTDTGMYRSGGDTLAFATGGAIRALMYSGGFRIYTSGSYSAPSLHWTTDTNTGFYRHAENAIGVATGGGRRTLWNTDANLYHYSQLLIPNMSTTGSYNTVRWNTSNGHLMRYSSTIDIKEDVVSIAPVLEYLNERSLIHDLRPVLFHEKDQPDGTNNTRGEYLAGMIAEEVLEVAPELCYYDYDGNLTSYGIEALIPHLVAEIQRLSPLVEEMYGDANPDWVAPVPRSADSYMAERVRYDEAAAAQAEIGLVVLGETEEE